MPIPQASRFALMVFLGLTCGIVPSLARQPVSIAARIDSAVAAEMKSEELVGCAVGVLENGRIAHLKGYGFADREQSLAVSDQTLFRWASVSKPLTAIAALQLVEAGKLDLDRDIRDYVPEFPDHGKKITARHLLCHQGGIVHYANGRVVRTQRRYEEENPYENVILALDNFKESPLVNDPGAKFSYTTHGYILLSAVVERAGNKKFADQVHERISQPLGLTTLQPDYQWKLLPNRAVGYRKRQNAIVTSTDTDVSWKLGGGGFISNINDFAGFALGLLQGKLVNKQTEKAMWTPQATASGERTRFGLGFSVGRRAGAGLVVSHSGSQEKTRTMLLLFPEQKRGVVVMSNSEYANPSQIAEAIVKAAWPELARTAPAPAR